MWDYVGHGKASRFYFMCVRVPLAGFEQGVMCLWGCGGKNRNSSEAFAAA